jgi:hypothetical protein
MLAVEAILAVGGEGELNLRIKHEVADHTPVEAVHPVGLRQIRERVERPRRLLAGQHDRDDFVAAVRPREEAQVVLAFAREINR